MATIPLNKKRTPHEISVIRNRIKKTGISFSLAEALAKMGMNAKEDCMSVDCPCLGECCNILDIKFKPTDLQELKKLIREKKIDINGLDANIVRRIRLSK